jgi:hypothetical protein
VRSRYRLDLIGKRHQRSAFVVARELREQLLRFLDTQQCLDADIPDAEETSLAGPMGPVAVRTGSRVSARS